MPRPNITVGQKGTLHLHEKITRPDGVSIKEKSTNYTIETIQSNQYIVRKEDGTRMWCDFPKNTKSKPDATGERMDTESYTTNPNGYTRLIKHTSPAFSIETTITHILE